MTTAPPVDLQPDAPLTLGLPTGARVLRLERLRLADDVVMACEVNETAPRPLPGAAPSGDPRTPLEGGRSFGAPMGDA
jgi:UTRA domain